MKNVITLRHQLVRKRSVIKVPQTVKVILNKNKSVNLHEIKQKKQQKVQYVPSPQPNNVPSPKKVVSKKKQLLIKQALSKKPKTKVKYVTFDINPESHQKIHNLRGIGKDRLLVIIGNGPSITEIDLAILKGIANVDLMSINKPDPRVWPTRFWAFCDKSQYRNHEDLWKSYNGTIINSTAIAQQKSSSLQIKNLGGIGFSTDMSKGFHIGRSTVYAQMQVAIWMGYNHIYIFGVDMNPDGLNGKLHFYGVNPDVAPDVRKKRFDKEAEYYEHAANILPPDIRNKFTFCSTYNHWPFVDKFNKMDHKIAITAVTDHARRLMTGE